LASSRIVGNLPLSSQVWKNGVQSISGTRSASGKFSNSRVPMNDGFVGL
jgi:hypothetical protein